jgi:hypothetical protein
MPLHRTLVALLGFGTFTAAGCTLTVNDGLPNDAGPDALPDGAPIEDAPPVGDADAPNQFAVVIRAADLIGGSGETDIEDLGGGSTRAEIVGFTVAYALAKSGAVESSPIEKTGANSYLDGRLVGLPPGVKAAITVTGYLRGLNGDLAAAPDRRIPWATATCEATPSATADVVATCGKLKLGDQKGVVFASDVLPPDYCTGKGATDFSRLRARLPYDGPAAISRATDDCRGVIWVPSSEFTASETAGITNWSLSLEAKSAGTACTLKAPGCRVDRNDPAGGFFDIVVMGEGCRLNATTTGSASCF